MDGTVARAMRISVPDVDLIDLRERLSKTRYPDQLLGTTWEYGMDIKYLTKLIDYWEHAFDWRKQESLINTFGNFMMEVNGIRMHFVHEQSPHAGAVPLLFLHGWPGSFFEGYKIVKKLTRPGREPAADGTMPQAFHVVAPSLPGYGFSSAPTQPGFGIRAIAATVNELMLKLGYGRYVAQGGDWGGFICRALGTLHAQHVAAIHVNLAFATPSYTSPWHMLQVANSLPIARCFPVFLSSRELKGLGRLNMYRTAESGYFKEQSTKPQTIGYGLTDSPAGLLAYIVEKFQTWGDCKGDVESRFTMDELLTNVCIYWFNANITSSMRLYREVAAGGDLKALLGLRVTAPTAVANFPGDIVNFPRSWVQKQYNLKQWSVFDSGGHFAALEEPNVLVADMRKFFSKWH